MDELYNGGTSESQSFEENRITSPVNKLRLSSHQLRKPRMNPKSFDSDHELKMFSREEDHYLHGLSAGENTISKRDSNPPISMASDLKIQEVPEDLEVSRLDQTYDEATASVKEINQLALSQTS